MARCSNTPLNPVPSILVDCASWLSLSQQSMYMQALRLPWQLHSPPSCLLAAAMGSWWTLSQARACTSAEEGRACGSVTQPRTCGPSWACPVAPLQSPLMPWSLPREAAVALRQRAATSSTTTQAGWCIAAALHAFRGMQRIEAACSDSPLEVAAHRLYLYWPHCSIVLHIAVHGKARLLRLRDNGIAHIS